MYIKIDVDGNISAIAPRYLTDDEGLVHYNPPHEMYVAVGWLEVVETEPPASAARATFAVEEESGEAEATDVYDELSYLCRYEDDGAGHAVQVWRTSGGDDKI